MELLTTVLALTVLLIIVWTFRKTLRSSASALEAQAQSYNADVKTNAVKRVAKIDLSEEDVANAKKVIDQLSSIEL